MKRVLMAVAVVPLMIAVAAGARETERREVKPLMGIESPVISLDMGPDAPGLQRTDAPGDTTWLGSWAFDGGGGGACTNDGWVSVDLTAQMDFVQVEDFAGMGGGQYTPLEGSQSVWCGARANATHLELCQYAALPGYGNNWDQAWRTANCLPASGISSFDYLITYETEPGYDVVSIEYDHCDDNWQAARSFSGYRPREFISDTDDTHSGSIRWRVRFSSDGAWSDQDGMWDTDGAYIIDSLTVVDASGTVLPTELFESESPGDHASLSGNWVSTPAPGYGDFAALFNGMAVVQEDPCVSNLSCVWGFFNGSAYNYACGGFPGQAAVPYENARQQFLNNEIRSPVIPFAGAGDNFELHFDQYPDLQLDALVLWQWRVRSIVGGCATRWKDRDSGAFGPQKEWLRRVRAFGDLLEPGATGFQVALAVMDRCDIWCGSMGSGSCHSHGPLYDNVEVIRIDSDGPVWYVRSQLLFQDTFASDGSINDSASGRADMAADVAHSSNPNIVPGDSAVVIVSDQHGLAADPLSGFGSAVYMYAAVWPQGQAGIDGGGISDDSFRWPVVDSTTYDGATWYCVRMDTVFTGAGRTGGILSDGFCVDLNDNLFTVGDTICFAFCAENTQGERTYWTPFTGTTTSLAEALANPDEFQILPGGGYANGGEILYVDGFDGHGAQPYFDTAFEMAGILDEVDRFDIRAPEATAGNRLGSRVVNVLNQIIAPYDRIYWNTGDLPAGTIGDGTGSPEKSDDAFVLYTFINEKTTPGGLYLSGDDLADEFYNKQSPGANLVLLKTYIQGAVNPGDNSANAAGFGANPLAVGEPGSCFDHILGPDEFIAFGGCPGLNDFDVITPVASATLEMNYGGAPGQSKGAIIGQITNNTAGVDVGVLLSGFSYHYIRDDVPAGIPARVHHLADISAWLNQFLLPTNSERIARPATTLGQNYPNPFNPQTAIEFTVRDRTHVTLRIYNAAGQLVRTLVSDVRSPGIVHTVEWDGRSDAGSRVASGVYFYRLVTQELTQTKKMVLLK